MRIHDKIISQHNDKWLTKHQLRFVNTQHEIPGVEDIIKKLMAFNVAIPSWALGTGGTRFGRF